ncbi:MAG: beta-ketoacyl-[acyl-carrier-protein] synthase family protein [Gammaproteobacteria bacterium]
MNPLPITALATASSLGLGLEATLSALQQGRSGLRPNDFGDAALPTWIGRVDGIGACTLPGALQAYDCRNNRLAHLALEQDGFREAVARARQRWGSARIGVFLGTTTSGILATEQAYQSRDASGALPASFDYAHTHSLYSVTSYVRASLQLGGPAYSISTACSSSAKVFAAASRMIAAGACDAAVVGGVDSLCHSILYGFNSLALLSSQPCRPWDAQRDGLSLGEAAGFALLEREADSDIALLGYGESADAHHMSTPHPAGAGALLAMQAALQRAGLAPQAIDYVNLHGTASPANDRAEDQAVSQLFGTAVACSSTKGHTGHTLGAAGITEAIVCALALRSGIAPPTLHQQQADPALHCRVLTQPRPMPIRRVMSNSFGFGGDNCALVLGHSA